MNELKPCPFCGSVAVLYKNPKDTYKPYCVICQNGECSCNARIPYCDTEEDAVRQWNRRV